MGKKALRTITDYEEEIQVLEELGANTFVIFGGMATQGWAERFLTSAELRKCPVSSRR